MKLYLVDRNPDLVAAWQELFAGLNNVFICEGDILSIAEDTIVSPANIYGFMDGGIDRLYVDLFGLDIQQKLQEKIGSRPEGYLPIGSAELIKTNHSRIPYLIAAPTMTSPEAVPARNCFYATIAILSLASRHPSIDKIFCPGLGTGIGCVPPHLAAQEMVTAYRKWLSRLVER
jgi:O-acetyl-ADP-ribose deacetylase (regulator of RNase III)